jgi:hypothetical protein
VKRYANLFASTRSDVPASQAGSGTAQWSVGSIEDDGIRYGFTTQALMASTAATAIAIVSAQSTIVGQGAGSDSSLLRRKTAS